MVPLATLGIPKIRVSHWPRPADPFQLVTYFGPTILVSLRNVIYISHYTTTYTKMQDYRRILDISTASSSENTGTAFDLCIVAIPFTLVPVYTLGSANDAEPPPVSTLLM